MKSPMPNLFTNQPPTQFKRRTYNTVFSVATLLLGFAAGCTKTPDPCEDAPFGCVAVTVTDGPVETYQLLVQVLDGYGSTTPTTPRRLPSSPLTYPLRFAIRFDEFDRRHKGQVTFEVTANSKSGDTLGQLQKTVAIEWNQHVAVSVALGPPLDLASTDQAEAARDLSATADAGSKTDGP